MKKNLIKNKILQEVIHLSDPLLEYVPAGHFVQEDERFKEYVPAGQ